MTIRRKYSKEFKLDAISTIGELILYAQGASGGTSSCARTDVPILQIKLCSCQ